MPEQDPTIKHNIASQAGNFIEYLQKPLAMVGLLAAGVAIAGYKAEEADAVAYTTYIRGVTPANIQAMPKQNPTDLNNIGRTVLSRSTLSIPLKQQVTGVTGDSNAARIDLACPSPDTKTYIPAIQSMDINSQGLASTVFCANNKVDFHMNPVNPASPTFQSSLQTYKNDKYLATPYAGEQYDASTDLVLYSCPNLPTVIDLTTMQPKLALRKNKASLTLKTEPDLYCHAIGVTTIQNTPYIRKANKKTKKVGKPVIYIPGLSEITVSGFAASPKQDKTTLSFNGLKKYCKGKNKSKIKYGFYQTVKFTMNPEQTFVSTLGDGRRVSTKTYKTKPKKLCK